MELSREQVQCAVEWWVSKLKSPEFDNGDKKLVRLWQR
jgi:hypothetical protein